MVRLVTTPVTLWRHLAHIQRRKRQLGAFYPGQFLLAQWLTDGQKAVLRTALYESPPSWGRSTPQPTLDLS